MSELTELWIVVIIVASGGVLNAWNLIGLAKRIQDIEKRNKP